MLGTKASSRHISKEYYGTPAQNLLSDASVRAKNASEPFNGRRKFISK